MQVPEFWEPDFARWAGVPSFLNQPISHSWSPALTEPRCLFSLIVSFRSEPGLTAASSASPFSLLRMYLHLQRVFTFVLIAGQTLRLSESHCLHQSRGRSDGLQVLSLRLLVFAVPLHVRGLLSDPMGPCVWGRGGSLSPGVAGGLGR